MCVVGWLTPSDGAVQVIPVQPQLVYAIHDGCEAPPGARLQGCPGVGGVLRKGQQAGRVSSCSKARRMAWGRHGGVMRPPSGVVE